MIWLWLVAVSWAESGSLVRPSPSIPAPGECSQSIPIPIGEAIPDTLAENGVAKCSAIAEPTSSLAHLLALETYSIAADELHALELGQLHAEIDGLRTEPGWLERPKTQRWLGRVEAAVVVTALAAGYMAIERGSR
jgi:hypothetical protein